MTERTRIILKSGKDQSLRRKHPWVFSGAIKKIHGIAAPGSLVDVYDNKEELLGTGHYQEGSIAVRILTLGGELIDNNFWKQRISSAWAHRKDEQLYQPGKNDIFRLINAEGDGLPGLIVDYYNGAVIIQVHSAGMHKSISEIVDAIKNLDDLPIDTIYNKSRNTLHTGQEKKAKDEFLMGVREDGEVNEHGNRFRVNWVRGQKTGFFIDQRENRQLLGQYAAGRKVLNMFCFSGGFSVYAIRGGAEAVHSVDSSAHAIDLTDENISTNCPDYSAHESIHTDAFEYLAKKESIYDLIILDPPAFAKHQRVLNNALQGYKRLNQQAIEKIRPGGILFTFSCSQAVSRENFRKSVFAAAANSGRSAKILHQMSQPADHPVSIFHPEGEYLKGLVMKID